jgi:hypothetical protein
MKRIYHLFLPGNLSRLNLGLTDSARLPIDPLLKISVNGIQINLIFSFFFQRNFEANLQNLFLSFLLTFGENNKVFSPYDPFAPFAEVPL